MHGLVILDRSACVIRPSLIWCDQRCQPQVDFINDIVGKEKILESIANPVLTGFTLPKLLWVRDHEPRNFERVQKLLLPKDYVRFWLTGEFATEVSDASGTALLDVVHRRWSFDMMDSLDLDRDILPSVHELARNHRRVSFKRAPPNSQGWPRERRSSEARAIRAARVPLVTASSSRVSCPALSARRASSSLTPIKPCGTSFGRAHTFCHAVRDKWHVMGVTQGAGLSLQWLRNQLAPGVSYDALMSEAAGAPAGSQGLFWLPYLMGERTPHLDARARGGWIGLTAKHTRADLIRSVVEGVSYSQKDCLDILALLDVPVSSVRASGGGARSPFWRQILADVFAKPVVSLENQEGSAYGAALLSMVGTGEFASVPEACRATIREAESVTPRAVESARLRARIPDLLSAPSIQRCALSSRGSNHEIMRPARVVSSAATYRNSRVVRRE